MQTGLQALALSLLNELLMVDSPLPFHHLLPVNHILPEHHHLYHAEQISHRVELLVRSERYRGEGGWSLSREDGTLR